METHINVYKRLGETPLECLNRLRTEHREYADVTLSYAGRLDPMAEGVLLVLAGKENKNRDQYLSLRKEYRVDILFGFATDTYDMLGLVSETVFSSRYPDVSVLSDEVRRFVGGHEQEYPPFSSKTVAGKTLFAWAKEGALASIEIPHKNIEIYACDLIQTRMMSKEALLNRVSYALAHVHGDFRQHEIKERWESVLRDAKEEIFSVASMHVACSSGTYVRSLAHDLGKRVSTGAFALRIIRTKVGDADVQDSLR